MRTTRRDFITVSKSIIDKLWREAKISFQNSDSETFLRTASLLFQGRVTFTKESPYRHSYRLSPPPWRKIFEHLSCDHLFLYWWCLITRKWSLLSFHVIFGQTRPFLLHLFITSFRPLFVLFTSLCLFQPSLTCFVSNPPPRHSLSVFLCSWWPSVCPYVHVFMSLSLFLCFCLSIRLSLCLSLPFSRCFALCCVSVFLSL